jgi:hypothetical protein
MRRKLGNAAFAACLVVVCLSMACSGQGNEEATYDISVKGEGNEIVVDSGSEEVQFEVFSEVGIGSAQIEVTEGDFPGVVDLLFHLRGLEELRLGYDSTEITLSVSSSDNSVYQYVTQESLTSDSITPLNPDSPYWLEVNIIDLEESLDAPPGSDRLISVLLPDDFTSGDYESFRINWIDFFR